MNKDQKHVAEFHRKFGLPVAEDIHEAGFSARHFRIPSFEDARERVRFLLEEVEELEEALLAGRYGDVIDGLVDIIYVANGTAHFMQVDLEPFMDEVHKANMGKELPPKGSTNMKVIKPPGWKPPNLDALLSYLYPPTGWVQAQGPTLPGSVSHTSPAAYTRRVLENAATPRQRHPKLKKCAPGCYLQRTYKRGKDVLKVVHDPGDIVLRIPRCPRLGPIPPPEPPAQRMLPGFEKVEVTATPEKCEHLNPDLCSCTDYGRKKGKRNAAR